MRRGRNRDRLPGAIDLGAKSNAYQATRSFLVSRPRGGGKGVLGGRDQSRVRAGQLVNTCRVVEVGNGDHRWLAAYGVPPSIGMWAGVVWNTVPIEAAYCAS